MKPINPKFLGENGVHRVPLWRVAGFACNNLATNMYMFSMMYLSYYLIGFVGVATVLASSFSTIMRLWDGVTDPFVGMIVDRTNGKFGKNRPFMVIGNVILFVTSYVLFHFTHLIGTPTGVTEDGIQILTAGDAALRFAFFTVVSAVYYIGYTCQCVVTKSAQTCLTNDPKQRPLFAIFDSAFVMVGYIGIGSIAIPGLTKKYGTLYSVDLFHDIWVICALASAVLTVIAVISIAPKDRIEFFGTGKVQKIGFKDYWDTIKNNRAIQMLVVAASTDKLASSTKTSTVTVVLYGIVTGIGGVTAGVALGASRYAAVNGALAALSLPGMVLTMAAIATIAPKLGQKAAMLIGSWGGIIINSLLAALWLFGDPSQLVGLNDKGEVVFVWGTFAIIHALLTVTLSVFTGMAGNIVIPMTADCADYEVYRTGKYVPGMMGTLFSFVDKLISSAAPMIAGLLFAAIGFADKLPDVTTEYSFGLHAVSVFLMYGMIIIGNICNVIAMKFYPLSKEKMEEIQDEIAAIKAKAMAEAE